MFACLDLPLSGVPVGIHPFGESLHCVQVILFAVPANFLEHRTKAKKAAEPGSFSSLIYLIWFLF
jgi:hypothetical protein